MNILFELRFDGMTSVKKKNQKKHLLNFNKCILANVFVNSLTRFSHMTVAMLEHDLYPKNLQ